MTDVRATIIELKETLRDGWDEGQGVRLSDAVVQLALDVCRRLAMDGFAEVDTLPGSDGSLLLIVHVDEAVGVTAEVVVNVDTTLDVYIHTGALDPIGIDGVSIERCVQLVGYAQEYADAKIL